MNGGIESLRILVPPHVTLGGNMSFTRKSIRSLVVGALAGAMLAVTLPPQVASAAEDACTCDDDGFGNYKCSRDQQSCIAGGQVCDLHCVT